MKLIALASIMLCAHVVFAQSMPATKEKWAPGKYIVVAKSIWNQTADKEKTAANEVERRYELTVQKPESNGQKVQIVFSRLSLQEKGSEILTGLHYDTDKPAGDDRNSLQLPYKAMIGMPIEVTIGINGKIGEISGLDEIGKKAVLTNSPIGASGVANLCKSEVNSALKLLLFRFPEEPIVKGLAWTRNDPMDLGGMDNIGTIKMRQDCKVKSVEDTSGGKVAEIDFAAKNTSDKLVFADEKAAKIFPIDEITRQISGTIKVNLDTRMMVSTKLHTKTTMKGTITMEGTRPFNFLEEDDAEVVVAPAKGTPTSSTGPSR